MKQNQDNGYDNLETVSWQYQAERSISAFPWGPHSLPVKLSLGDLSLAFEKSGEGFLYRREDQSGSVEKSVLAGKGEIYLCPVEPFHHPAGVSQHLLLEFDHPVLLEPRSNTTINLTFPLEIAVIFDHKKSGEAVLDVFSFITSKLTLYGNVKSGLICRYWQSSIHHDLPHLNPAVEGLMRLTISNSGSRWAEVKQALFSAQAMKLYYNKQLVAMQGGMKINSIITAETSVVDEPLKTGMSKAPEQFSAGLLRLPGRLVMEEGY
jgi:uncharacterized protein